MEPYDQVKMAKHLGRMSVVEDIFMDECSQCGDQVLADRLIQVWKDLKQLKEPSSHTNYVVKSVFVCKTLTAFYLTQPFFMFMARLRCDPYACMDASDFLTFAADRGARVEDVASCLLPTLMTALACPNRKGGAPLSFCFLLRRICKTVEIGRAHV